jgi:rhomboid protease GluP
MSATETESFADYLARYFIAKRQYTRELLPELEPLAKVCDHLLVRRDGLTFAVAVIVDRDKHPDQFFQATADEVRAIAESCLHYTGRMGRTKLPVVIDIYETGANTVYSAAEQRLAAYSSGVYSKVNLAAWLIDPVAQDVWTSRGLARLAAKRAIEKLVRGPRLDASDLQPKLLAVSADRPPPYFTWLLIALLLVLFALELVFGLDNTDPMTGPSLRTLHALGGLSHEAIVNDGQWWRIFTAPLLHANLMHVLFNCLALFLIGRLLEPLIGWRWTAATFAISAIGGSLLSLAINPPTLLGVGASGGIVGLFAAAVVIVRRVPSTVERTRLLMQAMYGLLPALLPFLSSAASGERIDYGAHIGGALGGVAMALVLLRAWPGELPRPKWPRFAALVAVAYLAVAGLAIVPINQSYGSVAALDPNWPKTVEEAEAQASQLVHDYPNDPRARLVNGIALSRQNQLGQAEQELRTGLADAAPVRGVIGSGVEEGLRLMLGGVLLEEGHRDEAARIAKPLCGLDDEPAAQAKKLGLCS